jgi:dynamin 1-like protein
MNVLSGSAYPLKLGFVGVVSRSQQDINNNKPIRQMLQEETKFFMEHSTYSNIAGTFSMLWSLLCTCAL